MPFTLSHPAAAVPFARKGLILSALVVGSMSPDFIYFVRLAPRGSFGHTLLGVFFFCLPTSLVVLWLFHELLKPALLTLMPFALQARLVGMACDFSFNPPQRFALIVTSVIVGAVTHILWDGFTHKSGWAVRLLPPLNWVAIEVGSEPMRIYRLLQHLSTFAGAGLLLLWAARWLRHAPAGEVDESLRLTPSAKLMWALALAGGSAFAGLLYGMFQARAVTSLTALKVPAVRGVIASVTALFAALVLFGLHRRLSEARRGLGRTN